MEPKYPFDPVGLGQLDGTNLTDLQKDLQALMKICSNASSSSALVFADSDARPRTSNYARQRIILDVHVVLSLLG